MGFIVRIITGHNNLRYHSHLRNPAETPDNQCIFCQESEETFHHLVTTCPRFKDWRQEIFEDYEGPQLMFGKWKMDDIMLFSEKDVIWEAIGYDIRQELFQESVDD